METTGKVMEDTDKRPEEVPPVQYEDVECRACLQKFGYEAGLRDIFQPWEPPWNGMGDSIAQDLANIANVDITPADKFSKMICQFCHQKLLEVCSFVVNVRINDRLLRQRVETFHEQESSWPKPIQVNQNINSDVFTSPMDMEIKQELLSDDESYPNGADESFKEDVEGTDPDTFSGLEIKIEPEEIMQPPPIQITVNGTITHDQFEQNSILTNGEHKSPVQETEKVEIKLEPKSEEEEVEQPPDLSLDCMLCTKPFHSVTGLKMPPVKKTHKNIAKQGRTFYYNYSEEVLKKALHAIRCENKSISEVCRLCNVPRSTVQDWISRWAKEHPRRVGPEPVLGFEGEKKLVDWVLGLAKCGIPVSKDVLLESASNLIMDIGKSPRFPEGLGQSWYQRFMKRHPEIKDIHKARRGTEENPIQTWHSALESFLSERGVHDLMQESDRIIAADETVVPLSTKTFEIFAPKFSNIDTVKDGNVKVLTLTTASGKLCPPLIVLPYVKPPEAVVQNMPDGWVIASSESGCMQSDVFYEYIANNFHNWILENNIKKPVILFVDKHKSHMSMPLSKFCKENDIILYGLPPNTNYRAISRC